MAQGIFPARQELGVTPSTAVRANIDVRGTGGTGGAIGQAVIDVGTESIKLGRRFELIEAKTQLSESTVQSADEINRFFLELQGNDDPNTYGDEFNKLTERINAFAPKNSNAARVFNQNMATRSITLAKQTRTAAKDKHMQQAQAQDFLLLQKAKDSGEPADFGSYKAAVINGVKLGVYTAKEGESLLDDTDKEIEQAQKNTVFGIALSQRDEEGVLDTKAADTLVDASGLDENDKTDIRNQVENRSNQEKNRRDDAFKARTGEEDARLSELLLENQLTDQEIDLVDLESVGKQKTFEKNWKANWKEDLRKINILSEPASSVESVYDDLVVGSELVERGLKSPAEWETEFRDAWANGDLEKTDRRSLRKDDIVATKTMQNRSFTAQTDGASDARFALVEATEDQLASFITARDLKLKGKDFTAAEALTKAIQKGQIQRWNFGRYRDALRTQMSQNPEWSQKQIFTASDILINDFDKGFDVLVKEFDAANPTQAITKNPPDDTLADIWKDLSVDDKAKIWELRLRGATIEEIRGELP